MAEGTYLIHFEKPYTHAKHYVGFSKDIEKRVRLHKEGKGARLLQVLRESGIAFWVTRVWLDTDRTFERKIKRSHNSARYCPICNCQVAAPFIHLPMIFLRKFDEI